MRDNYIEVNGVHVSVDALREAGWEKKWCPGEKVMKSFNFVLFRGDTDGRYTLEATHDRRPGSVPFFFNVRPDDIDAMVRELDRIKDAISEGR